MLDVEELNFEKGDGLVTVVVQDSATHAVLMVAHADRAALQRTLESGELHLHSRTRGAWHKGATSGNVQRIDTLLADCDGDTVLALVSPAGPACHTGRYSCFGERDALGDSIAALDAVVAERAAGAGTPDAASSSYTARLLGDRNLRLKKIGEESAELIAACADGDRERAVSEAADVVYHMTVALRALGSSMLEVAEELAVRRRK